MGRIRLLRILLPLLFLGFLVALVFTVKSRPSRGVRPAVASADDGARMEGFRFSDLVGGRRRLLVEAGMGRMDGQGSFEIEDVRRAEVDREEQPPLVIAAPKGSGSGSQGRRVMRLEGGVTLRDDETGLTLEIPTVEIDQIHGVARSRGEVTLKGERWSGRASAIVYSLDGKPAEILNLVLDGADGEHLEAQRALIAPGGRKLTLEGNVLAHQGGFELRAPHVELDRDAATGRLQRATAGPGVRGTAEKTGRGPGRFAAQDGRVTWGPDGAVTGFVLTGAARVEHARGTISAEQIEAQATAAAGETSIRASGRVDVSGNLARGPGRLTCAALSGTLAAGGEVRDGVATGDVRFSGDGTSGEASEARFAFRGNEGTITLASSVERRARIANGRTRVAADSIVSDGKGQHVEAHGRVESTLLPDPARRASTPMFGGAEAIHFVSASLVSDGGGAVITFRGDVRGWQGERSLAAGVVEMRQEGEAVDADGGVVTRIPRESGLALRETDFIQITADRLAYRGAARTAGYAGNVRVRQSEGWLEAPRLDATLGDGSERGIRSTTATGGVRFEYRSRSASGSTTTATGRGDRATYEAAGRAIRLFGEKAAASIVATGDKAGTTTGRVLRYEIDTGALEVESGERDRATIKTPTE